MWPDRFSRSMGPRIEGCLIDMGQNGLVRCMNRFCQHIPLVKTRSQRPFGPAALTTTSHSVWPVWSLQTGGPNGFGLAGWNIYSHLVKARAVRARAELGLLGFWLSELLVNGANRLIGIGRIVVVLCSLEISFIVCKKRIIPSEDITGLYKT